MTDDLNIWLDGVPVIPTPGGDNFDIWLEGAPVVSPGGSDTNVACSGSEVLTETGTCNVVADLVITCTGSECATETGTCTVNETLVIAVTGSEVSTETGIVTVESGISGSQIDTETGTVICRVINPTPAPGGGGSVRISTRWHYTEPKKKKKRPSKYRRSGAGENANDFEVLEVEIPEKEPIQRHPDSRFEVIRVYGSESRSETGLIRTKIDHPEDQAIIEMVLKVLEEQDRQRDQEELDAVLSVIT